MPVVWNSDTFVLKTSIQQENFFFRTAGASAFRVQILLFFSHLGFKVLPLERTKKSIIP
jgi:hypothetical protein